MSHLTRYTFVTITCAIILIAQEGCGKKIASSEKQTFSKLYADLLMVQTNWTNDSIQQAKAIDSILKGTAFTSIEDVKKWLEEATIRDPEGLRETIDSTQKYLEQFREVPNPQKSDTPATP